MAACSTSRLRLDLTANDEDFGQTLAVWGVGSGPYLMLPFFGPSSLRDAPSRFFDYFLGPLVYMDVPWECEWGMRGLDIVHSRAELLSLDPTLQNAFDPYAFMRDAWAQQTRVRDLRRQPAAGNARRRFHG